MLLNGARIALQYPTSRGQIAGKSGKRPLVSVQVRTSREISQKGGGAEIQRSADNSASANW